MYSPKYCLVLILLLNCGTFIGPSREVNEMMRGTATNNFECSPNIDCMSFGCDCFREPESKTPKLQGIHHRKMKCPSFSTPVIDPSTTLPVCCLYSHLSRLKKVLDTFNKRFDSANCILNLKELMVRLMSSPNYSDFMRYNFSLNCIGKRRKRCTEMGVFHSTIYYHVFSRYSQKIFESCRSEVDRLNTLCSLSNDTSCDREKWFTSVASLLEKIYRPNIFKIKFIHRDRVNISQGSEPSSELVEGDHPLGEKIHPCPMSNGISGFYQRFVAIIACGSLLFSYLSHILIQC